MSRINTNENFFMTDLLSYCSGLSSPRPDEAEAQHPIGDGKILGFEAMEVSDVQEEARILMKADDTTCAPTR
jgi:hypothetical protein